MKSKNVFLILVFFFSYIVGMSAKILQGCSKSGRAFITGMFVLFIVIPLIAVISGVGTASTTESIEPTPISTPKSRLNGTIWLSKYYSQEARSFDKKHRYNEAIKSFTKSIETGVLGHHSRAIKNTYYLRGESYKKSGQYQNAIDDFTIFLNANPELIIRSSDFGTSNHLFLSEGYFSRGYSYYQLREYQKALDDFNKAIELRPSNERYLRALINNAKDSLGRFQQTSN